jgi:hypothetical protein
LTCLEFGLIVPAVSSYFIGSTTGEPAKTPPPPNCRFKIDGKPETDSEKMLAATIVVFIVERSYWLGMSDTLY